MTDFATQLAADADRCADMLDSLFKGQTILAPRLGDAMRYAVLNGGKRMRAGLVLGAARLASTQSEAGIDDENRALRVAAALECLHAYSLIHDDLPAMDDADTRRGKPSCHIAFDEATAILAGDALQTLAFEILADDATHPDPAVRVALIAALARASGLAGMAGGQMLDLQAETRDLTLAETQQMQMMKTGALIVCAATCGAIVGGASSTLVNAISAYADKLGLAFQIADDLLDYDGDSDGMGKPVGQDAIKGKASFVTLMGLENAKNEADSLIANAQIALAPWQDQADYLVALAGFAVTRRS
ncbi:polyprenyl synthetase family protein [Alphaproteobacteria bacterium]|jgi:farnesyl diphosphate synthase|nr:polyprenyl synthetase family protein [Alphaproteobacteria bacterium]